MALQFVDLGLNPPLMQAVETLKFIVPTPIQEQAIPFLLYGRNVVGQAQTGTGKTAAFSLPLLQGIEPGNGNVQALVLTPTRELAIQVADAAAAFAQHTSIRIATVYGGQSYEIQIRALRRGCDVVVGTPGRLMDLMRKNILDLSHVKYLVLDEADEMLDMGFAEDVETILSAIPSDRQIALFSATFPHSVKKLAEKHVSNPEHIRINPSKITVSETDQRYCRVREDNKLSALTRILEVEQVQSALVFTRTKSRAQDIADELSFRGFPAESLHGDLNQARRESVLNRFRAHTISFLVATDVAARGLDIDDLSHVINYDIPQDAEDYVHRIGRTGRAGNKGTAITFFTPKERNRLGQIEAFTRQSMSEFPIPTKEQVLKIRDEKFTKKLLESLGTDKTFRDKEIVTKLVKENYDISDIAAAAIRIARSAETALPNDDLITVETDYRIIKLPGKNSKINPPKMDEKHHRKISSGREKTYSITEKDVFPRKGSAKNEPGMIRLKMNIGKYQGIRPGDIVGAIAGEVGIPGQAIGEIIIQKDHSYVDVAEKHIRQVLRQSTGKYSLRGKPVVLTLAK